MQERLTANTCSSAEGEERPFPRSYPCGMWEEKKGKHPVQGASRGTSLPVAGLGCGHGAWGSIMRPHFLSGDPSLHSQRAQ